MRFFKAAWYCSHMVALITCVCGRIWLHGTCSSSATHCLMATQPGGPLRWSAQRRRASWCCWMASIGLTWELWQCYPGKPNMGLLAYLLIFDKLQTGRSGAVIEMCTISMQAAARSGAGSVWWNSATEVGPLSHHERSAPAHWPWAAGEVPRPPHHILAQHACNGLQCTPDMHGSEENAHDLQSDFILNNWRPAYIFGFQLIAALLVEKGVNSAVLCSTVLRPDRLSYMLPVGTTACVSTCDYVNGKVLWGCVCERERESGSLLMSSY